MSKNSRNNCYLAKIFKVQRLPYGRYLRDEDVIRVGDLKLWRDRSPAKLTSGYKHIGKTISSLEASPHIYGYYRPAVSNKRYRWLKAGEVIREGDQHRVGGEWSNTSRAGECSLCDNFYRRRRHIRTRV